MLAGFIQPPDRGALTLAGGNPTAVIPPHINAVCHILMSQLQFQLAAQGHRPLLVPRAWLCPTGQHSIATVPTST